MPRVLSSTAYPAVPWRSRLAGEDYGVTAQPDWREIDWSAHERQVEVQGAHLNYVDLGPTAAGPKAAASTRAPVILVHGLSGRWQTWLENIPRIAQDRRVIAIDLPGFGQSEMPPAGVSIPAYGRAIDALCNQLELGLVDIVGNSMGGFIASEVAVQFPQRVGRLVLVSAAGITNANLYRRPTLLVGRLTAVLTAHTAARFEMLSKRPRTRHAAFALVARYPGRLKADLIWEGLVKGTGKPGFNDALAATLEYDFRERLPEIACPALIVWGQNDSVLPVKDAEEFERLIPDSRKLLMQETGHIPQVERPETFNDALLGFLDEVGGARREDAAEAA